MTLIPKSGQNSPHSGVIRINWEIFPTNQNGSYDTSMPMDIGVVLFRNDSLTFDECKQKVEDFLKIHTEDKNFFHIWKRGVSL